jgi:hypothetical protein
VKPPASAQALGSAVNRGLANYRRCRTWVDEEDLRQEGWLAALTVARQPFVSKNADGSGFGARAYAAVWRSMLAHVTTSISPVSASNRGSERAKLREAQRAPHDEHRVIVDAVSDPEHLLLRDANTARVTARLDALFTPTVVDMLMGERRARNARERQVLERALETARYDDGLRAIWEDWKHATDTR